MINGLQPGPTLFTQHADLALTVIASMVISNGMLLVMSLPLVGVWARISLVPYSILGPIVLGVCVIGAYAPRNTLFDVCVAILFGVVGYVMRRLDWPMAPLILGFLLGRLFEQSLRQSLSISDGSIAIFFSRPIPAACIAAAVLVTVVMLYVKWRSRTVSGLIAKSANEL